MINLLHEVLQNYPKLFRLSILKPIFYHHTLHILRKSVLYSLPTTIQKLFCSYILVGDFTIITPISFAIKSLKLIRIWQMKLLLISCRRR